MSRKRQHSFDGRYTIVVDEDDIEIAKLLLADKNRQAVMREFRDSGRSLDYAVSVVREAEFDIAADADQRAREGK